MTGDGQARICEGLGVKFPGATRPISDGRPYRDSNFQVLVNAQIGQVAKTEGNRTLPSTTS